LSLPIALGMAGMLAAVLIAPVAGPRGTPVIRAAEPEAKTSRDQPSKDELNRLVNRGKTRAGKTIRDATPFTVRKRSGGLDYFPCSDCHEGEKVNPREREFTEEHQDIVLVHGGGRFWCLTCHNLRQDSDTFLSLKGEAIDFDKAYLLCGQCHFERQKDWYFGGHGKRVGAFPEPGEIPASYTELKAEQRDRIGTWRGERRLLSCPACHNPHSPSIKPYQPSPPPRVRKGLSRETYPEPPRERIWDRMARPKAE
jgi:hypothetical protein